MSDRSVALVLGGGGARGLAHVGVLEVLEAEGIRADALAGTSIGGLVAALVARGLSPSQIAQLALGFRLPRRFLPGRLFAWDEIFDPAVPLLRGLSFADLEKPLAVSAVDLLAAEEVVLHSGPVLPAIRATCAIPGVLAPEPLGERRLVDGGVVNVLPVDLAWMWEPDTVIAVNIIAPPAGARGVRFGLKRVTTALGRIFPTVLTAHSAYLMALRAVDVALARQRSLALAMTCPDVVIDVDVGHVAVGDFHRLGDVIESGRLAARAALPRIREAMATARRTAGSPGSGQMRFIDPVCHMIVSPGRARAVLEQDGVHYYFCSTNCRDLFVRHGARTEPARSTGTPPYGTGGDPDGE